MCAELGIPVRTIDDYLHDPLPTVRLLGVLGVNLPDQRVADARLASQKRQGLAVALLTDPHRLTHEAPGWQGMGVSYRGMWFLASQYISTVRPKGAFVEFGVYDGHTMTLAYHALKNVCSEFFAFDSFAGLGGTMASEATHFADGQYFANEETFRHSMRYAGAPDERVKTVPGFFSESLVGSTPHRYGVNDVSIVHVDTDIYEPALQALAFIEPALASGALILFDDYDQMAADDNRGERRALREWLDSGDGRFHVEPYRAYGTFCRSFIFHRR